MEGVQDTCYPQRSVRGRPREGAHSRIVQYLYAYIFIHPASPPGATTGKQVQLTS